ncbi:MAG UNVERIFIED_CONTAM: hypothetical protein LVR18_21605 [Planctomycetaceae bacterium]
MCLCIVSAFGLLFPKEQILWGNGYGFDGWIYGEMVERFPGNVLAGELSEYYACRILPPVVVRSVLWLLRAEPNAANIIMAFRSINVLLMLAGTVLWIRLGKSVGLGQAVLVWGWLTLFGSLFTGRTLAYYPVLTDGWAIFWGLLLLTFSLNQNLTGLIIASIPASFTWPYAIWFAALLIVMLGLPRGTQGNTDWLKFPVKWWMLYAAGISIVIGISFFKYGLSPEVRVRGFRLGSVRLMTQHLLIFALWVYAILALAASHKPLQFLTSANALHCVRYLIAAVTIIVLHKWILAGIANPALPRPLFLMSHWLILSGWACGDGQVLTEAINHLFAAGPMIAFGAIVWRQVCKDAVNLGHGVVVGCVCIATAFLQPESRFAMLCLPFGVLAVCKSLSRVAESIPANVVFLVSMIYLSAVWRTFNPAVAIPGTYQVVDAGVPDLWNAAASEFLKHSSHTMGYEWDQFFWRGVVAVVVYVAAFVVCRPYLLVCSSGFVKEN